MPEINVIMPWITAITNLHLAQIFEYIHNVFTDHQRIVNVIGIKVVPRRVLWISLNFIGIGFELSIDSSSKESFLSGLFLLRGFR